MVFPFFFFMVVCCNYGNLYEILFNIMRLSLKLSSKFFFFSHSGTLIPEGGAHYYMDIVT